MKVAVIQGGPSLEAGVSRVSARAVADALTGAEHEVRLFELDRNLATSLLEFDAEVVFPALHGAQGEDGCVQGLLEILGLPYVGSAVLGSALAASKITTKVCYRAVGLPVANELVLSRSRASTEACNLLEEILSKLGKRVVLKPPLGGSALGIVHLGPGATAIELETAITEILAIDDNILVEEYVSGIELTCGVLETNGTVLALPPTQISAEAADWYDFKSKYSKGGSKHQCPAPLSPELTVKIQEAAVLAHRTLGLRDLSRTDFILRKDESFVLLETNTLPGMTGVSLFPEAAAALGIRFTELIESLCLSAITRGASIPRPAAEMP